MKDENDNVIPDDELLKAGLLHLDSALMNIMAMQSASGEALAHFIHAAFTFGEKLLTPVDA